MLAAQNPRKPAWALARGRMRLRLCVRPNAFGNALGGAFVDSMRPTDNRAMLNKVNQASDPDYYASQVDTPAPWSGSGLTLSAEQASQWGPQFSLDPEPISADYSLGSGRLPTIAAETSSASVDDTRVIKDWDPEDQQRGGYGDISAVGVKVADNWSRPTKSVWEMAGRPDSPMSFRNKDSSTVGGFIGKLWSDLNAPIGFLEDMKNESLGVLRPQMQSMYELSKNSDSFLERMAANMTLGAMAQNSGLVELGSPTSTLDVMLAAFAAKPTVSGVYGETKLSFKTLDGAVIGRSGLQVSADDFLLSRGIASPALRQQLIDSGLRTDLLLPDVTPTTLGRFDKLFPQTVAEGKAFSGRLGNVDTRIATINEAAALENAGMLPRFEYPVDVGNGSKRYVDLVGLDPNTMQPTHFVQFVKRDASGVVIRPDELVAAKQIEAALKLNPGTVRLVNTKR